MGVSLARSDANPDVFFGQLLPEQAKTQTNYNKQQLITARNAQARDSARMSLDMARSQMEAGTLPPHLYQSMADDLELAEKELLDSQRELELLESAYMKSIDVMSN